MALKIEIENKLQNQKVDGVSVNDQVLRFFNDIINYALSVNTLVDLKGKVFEMPSLHGRYFVVGFSGSHCWVYQVGLMDKRILLITEKK